MRSTTTSRTCLASNTTSYVRSVDDPYWWTIDSSSNIKSNVVSLPHVNNSYTQSLDSGLVDKISEIEKGMEKLNRRMSEIITLLLDIISKQQYKND